MVMGHHHRGAEPRRDLELVRSLRSGPRPHRRCGGYAASQRGRYASTQTALTDDDAATGIAALGWDAEEDDNEAYDEDVDLNQDDEFEDDDLFDDDDDDDDFSDEDDLLDDDEFEEEAEEEP